jgi:hypothetical protein
VTAPRPCYHSHGGLFFLGMVFGVLLCALAELLL